MRSTITSILYPCGLALGLSACGPAESADPEAAAAPAAPVVVEEAAPEPGVDEAAHADHQDAHSEHGEAAAEDDHGDHAEDHSEHDHHEGEEGGEEHDHEAHDHDEHDHDEHAGGAPHVHGQGDLSIILDGAELTVDLISPMSNFGLAESGEDVPGNDAFAAVLGDAGTLFTPSADANCSAPVLDARVDTSRAHADGFATWTFSCDTPDALGGVSTTLFDAFPTFEKLQVIGLKGDADTAAELTLEDPDFSFN